MGDLDLIRELPYGPALKGASQAGQMAASDQASELRNPSCAEGGVHRWEADIAQCDTALEKPFMITTPTTMKPMPIMAAESSFWPWISHATAATNTTPKPAQIA